MSIEKQLADRANELAGRLAASESVVRIVLAESCTGGRAAAAMVGVPGISNYFCGSAVVYRADSKTRWLGLPASLIEQHTAESAEVTAALAIAVLEQTPEATISGAITGHLEADSSRQTSQPHIFVAVAGRRQGGPSVITQSFHNLAATQRAECQTEAAIHLHDALLVTLQPPTG